MADLRPGGLPPAPWRLWGGDPLWHHLEDANGNYIACVDVVAAAPLIAAAPELLEALKAVDAAWSTDEDVDFPVAQVRAAIAKAEGR